MVFHCDGLREIAGKQIVEGGDVGGTLNAGVTAQGENPAAGAPDIAEQQFAG